MMITGVSVTKKNGDSTVQGGFFNRIFLDFDREESENDRKKENNGIFILQRKRHHRMDMLANGILP